VYAVENVTYDKMIMSLSNIQGRECGQNLADICEGIRTQRVHGSWCSMYTHDDRASTLRLAMFDDRQHQRRRMLAIVVHDVRRFDPMGRVRLLLAGIQIAVEPRKITAGNLQAEFVSG
jgi:hypothetical protein